MFGIETKYHGPTNCKGARISAQRSDGKGRKIFVPYMHELDQYQNHAFAALNYSIELQLKKCGYASASTQRGYIFAPIMGGENV